MPRQAWLKRLLGFDCVFDIVDQRPDRLIIYDDATSFDSRCWHDTMTLLMTFVILFVKTLIGIQALPNLKQNSVTFIDGF